MSATPENRDIRVLFIEDDEDIAHFVRTCLKVNGNGMEVHHFRDLRSGLIALKTGYFDVVLTDLNLPDSQGIHTVKSLLTVRKYVPVVVFSGTDEEREILAILSSGAQEYLIKGQSDRYVIARTIRQAMQRKQAEIRLRRLAHYDGLTGLANRTQFQRRLEYALTCAARGPRCLALMVIDLDRFKTINDTLGHHAGDGLLVQVAERLRGCVRQGDSVARLGGDEFTVILENLRDRDEAASVAQKILAAMSLPITLEGREVCITPSIGITLFPDDDQSAEGMLKNADAAMYQVKANGRNGFQFFAVGMNESTMEHLQMEVDLRQAIERDELVLYYQPKVSLRTCRLRGLEALVRWQRAGVNVMRPEEFIAIAEETGLIIPIGEWVMRKALAQTRRWLDEGLPATRVAVNISARQFRQRDLAAFIARALQEAGVRGEHLEVEITESLLMEDTEATVATLQRIKALGVHIAVDDFGTGYSSLNYLKRFHIDSLKIDRSFVSDTPHDQDDASITTAIIGLAKNLRLTVIAEGVETQEQVNFLRAKGCDEAQGYLFGAPLNATQLAGYLQCERTRAAGPQLSVIDGGNQVAV